MDQYLPRSQTSLLLGKVVGAQGKKGRGKCETSGRFCFQHGGMFNGGQTDRQTDRHIYLFGVLYNK